MKNVYFFIALLTMSASASGKGEYQPMVTAGPVVNGKFPHFGNQVVNSATGGGGSAPGNVSLRLIGRTHTKFSAGSFVPVDSYSYSYTNDRGGILANDNIDNDETLFYDESVYFQFDPTSASFVNRLKRMQRYRKSDGNVESLTYQPWRATLSDFRDSARYIYDYANGQMTSSTFEQYFAGMWTNSIPSYIDHSGALVMSMKSDFYKVDFTYDANARLVEMSDELNNNGAWEKKEKHTYEYFGSNVTKHFFYEWSSQQNNWLNKKNWQFEYDSDNVLVAKVEQEWDGANWKNIVRHEYAYDGNQNMTTDLSKTWNGAAFVDAGKEVWSYNIQNVPELITTSTWNGSSWVYTDNDKQYRLYYENYFPSEIEKIAGSKELNIYPVPAADVVNINMTLNSSEDIAVGLYDVKGAIVYGTTHRAISELQTAIPVSNLPAGTYFLRVAGGNTNLARSIIVQH